MRRKRAAVTNIQPQITYSKQSEPIVLSKAVSDIMLSQPNAGDLMALYYFYYYTAKWQSTDQPKSTTTYTAKGLDWSIERVRKRKNQLKELGLIKDMIRKGVGEKIIGHYIKINFCWGKSHYQQCTSTTLRKNQPLENPEGNALKTLSKREKNNLFPNQSLIKPNMFNMFWELYPNKSSKGQALTAWGALCKKQNTPSWDVIKKAILAQIKSNLWSNPKYIANASTWLNQNRWLNDPKLMIKHDDWNTKDKKVIIDDGIAYTRGDDGIYKTKTGKVYYP